MERSQVNFVYTKVTKKHTIPFLILSVIDCTNIARVVCTVVLLLQKNTLDANIFVSFEPIFTLLHGFNRSGFGNLSIPYLILSVIDGTNIVRVVCTVVLSLRKNTLDADIFVSFEPFFIRSGFRNLCIPFLILL